MFHPGIGIATNVPEPQVHTTGGSPSVTLDGPAGGELYFQRCRWCGNVTFRRLLCPTCASTDLEAEPSEGIGVVQRSAVIRRNTPDAHNVSVIDMREGFTVRCRVVGPPEKVRPGARVRVATTADPVRHELVFQLCDGPYSGWSPTAPAWMEKAHRTWATSWR